MWWRICFFAIVAAILAFCAGWWLRGQSAIDSCLDAGGRWEVLGGYCVGAIYGPPEV